jgi:uncharacterized membrane protein
MTTLLAIGFPYPTTAIAAAEDVLRLEPDLVSEPDDVAVVICDDNDAYHVTTNHLTGQDEHPFFWHLLLTALIFVPGSGTLTASEQGTFSQRLASLGLLESFQDKLREMLAPETSMLLLLAEQVPADALAALARFGGKVLAVSLVPDAEEQLAQVLRDTRGRTPPSARKPATGGRTGRGATTERSGQGLVRRGPPFLP